MAYQEFSPDESILLIRNMIEKTKQHISDKSVYFLLWGWGAFIGFTGQYILKDFFHYPKHYQIWWISGVCFIINSFYSFNHSKKEIVKTYVDENMQNLWIGLTISFMLLSIIFARIGWHNCYPFFMLLYGTGTFISGRIIKFLPLVIGGIISFVLAAVSVWFTDDGQMLFAGAAILFSYIIPGHLLHNNYRKTTA